MSTNAIPYSFLQVLKQVDHLRLNRHVERADGLVRDDEFGVERQGAGDADALALSAREFMRIAPYMLGPQAHPVEKRGDLLFFFLSFRDAVDGQRLADDAAHRHARVQGRIRILEDDLHLAPESAHRLPIQGADVRALEAHLARGRLDEAQDGPAGGGFAAPALSDESERLARLQIEADPVHGAHIVADPGEYAPAHREVLHHVFYFE